MYALVVVCLIFFPKKTIAYTVMKQKQFVGVLIVNFDGPITLKSEQS